MKIVLTGDALFSSRNLAKRLDPKVVEILQSADAVFTNAEFSTPKRNTPPGLCMYLTSVCQETLDEFVDLNIRLVNFANNHTTDYGWQGALETIEASEQRGIVPCGVGRNLLDARNAKFLDTSKGRVAVVGACSTWADRAVASMPGAEVVARPGLSPLRWGHSFVLPDAQFQQIRQIDELLGTAASMREVSLVECWDLPDADHIKFGSAMEGFLSIERGEKAGVRTFVNEEDQAALLTSIRDARKRADFVVASLHSHEGLNENWYANVAPSFVEEFAHKCIDAGADVFVGHGAHYVRGVEIYKGKPIFYSLGSLLMEFESGNSMISPEMYHTYGHPADSRPSDLHGGRAKDANGNWRGFYAERRFSLDCMVVVETDGEKVHYDIVPLDLNMIRPNPLHRGLPEFASPEAGQEIADFMAQNSEKYATKFHYDPQSGLIQMKGL